MRDSRSGNQYKVVFVGSSLTNRLDFNENSGCVYNLSLGGDSSLTGLGAIANSAEIPRLVFIEINVPERSVNQDLINNGKRVEMRISAIFYVENMPMNLALGLLHRPSKEKSAKTEPEINESILQNALALQLRNYQIPISSDILNNNLVEFTHMVRGIEEKGGKVILYEMPIHPDLENTPRAVQIRNAFKKTFPNHKLLDFHELAGGGAIRTMDGMHLSSSEAINVVENMTPYINSICTKDLSLNPR